jgi:hypothetical protein
MILHYCGKMTGGFGTVSQLEGDGALLSVGPEVFLNKLQLGYEAFDL